MARATKNRPVHEERLGRIKACVWENPTENGTMYNVTFARVYRDDEGWKETQSFGRDDCLILARLADMMSVALIRLECPYSEAMSQIVNTRPAVAGSLMKTDLSNQRQEYRADGGIL